MPEACGFDLYDERWRACWLAATAAARLRKKQVDVDIANRVQKLLDEFGPRGDKPLTLRIYGTMIKGFCVLSNERARSLTADCERLVLMFARQPFAEADSAMRLPASKKPRMEAALTLDIDLARVEASEAFDWTQAPLEEGALLRLGGGGGEVLPDDALLLPPAQPSLDFAGIPGEMVGGAAVFGVGPLETAWAVPQPGLEGVAAFPSADALAGPKGVEHGEVQEVLRGEDSQLVVMGETFAQAAAADQSVQPELAAAPVPTRQLKRRFETLLRPGAVYGFDGEPSISPVQYEAWQACDLELSLPRTRPAGYADQMDEVPEQAEHYAPSLRRLLDVRGPEQSSMPKDGDGHPAQRPEHEDALPQDHFLPQQDLDHLEPQTHQERENGISFVPPDAALDGPAVQWPEADLAQAASVGAGGVEAQDDRTAEVGQILRACLGSSSANSTKFHDLVPPGQAERMTAACTFSALLALASAGEFLVEQEEAYGPIAISLPSAA